MQGPEMPSVLLSANHLSKSFGARRAVDDVSFQVPAGQAVGLLGPSGAGKSTTAGMLCGQVLPDAGEVLLDGVAVTPGATAAKRAIGLVPQELALYEALSAAENLMLFGALYGLQGPSLAARRDEVLALVNLYERAHERVSTFSGGMKRRLNIACALLHEPRLLILDEPTAGVDPQSRNAIFGTLQKLRAEGCALLYTSHQMEEVERLADQIVIIDHGKVLADESPAALHARLPAPALLRVELQTPLNYDQLERLRRQPGVMAVAASANAYELQLAALDYALRLLAWLEHTGHRPIHFATARSSLEEVFLHLSGRSLRD
jgi:ABC-2 type transport system ATP-binding protein